MPAVQHYRERYCRRVVRDLPDDLQPEDMDVLGVLKSRVARAVAAQSSPVKGTPPYRRTPSWTVPGSPPSSRLQSVKRERSFHLGINKTVERAARSFDRYASSKAAMASAIRTEQPGLAQEQGGPATYDAYAVAHGGGVAPVPDHYTNLSGDPKRRAPQWDAVEEHERALRPNCTPGPPRIAIHYERAPGLFDAAAAQERCPLGLRELIRKEQERVARGGSLSTRDAELGVAWIDDAAPAAHAWLERQPGWDTDGHKDRRLSRLSAGRGVLTHVSGEIEYPAILANKPEARRNIRMGLAAWLESQRNARDEKDDGRILPMAIFDHLPDRLNDRRNVHCHFVIGTRRAAIGEDGSLAFAEHKLDAISRMGFVERLRGKFAELVNVELERIAADHRLHPGTYAEMGIEGATPNKKMFGRATILERAGVPTTHGTDNDIEDWQRLFVRAQKRRDDRLDGIEKLAVSEATRVLMRRAVALRHEAEEIGLLIGMTVSRAKRTARYAPAYAEAAKREDGRRGWLARAGEARAHLAHLDLELAPERAAVAERRREAARLDRAALEVPAREVQQVREPTALAAAHRAVDLIARTPLLVTERGGAYTVEHADDPDALVAGIDLSARGVQHRLKGQHAAQRKALAQVRSFVNKHGHHALFDEARIEGSAWMAASIRQWRSSPILAAEEKQRLVRARAHRNMLDERNRAWSGVERENIEAVAAAGHITLMDGDVPIEVEVNAEATAEPEAAPTHAPLGPITVAVERALPVEPLDADGWPQWRPGARQPVPAELAKAWRAAGMDAFATDIAGFEHVLAAPPKADVITDPALGRALGQGAARLTEPAIHDRLMAVWLYQEMTRRDLVAARHMPNFIPHPAPPQDSRTAIILADRARHAGDRVLAAMFEGAEGDLPSSTLSPNRLFRVALQAIAEGERGSVCRLLADAALGQPNALALRHAQLSDANDAILWASSSMPSKHFSRNRPGKRSRTGPRLAPPTFPGRRL
ncbi:MAG: hypothetical protein ABI240_11005 [Sphingomonas sp.]